MKISLAYSPDTDDAFMVHALKTGAVDPGPYEFSFFTGDIQELNEKARHETYDVTAISVAAYPGLADRHLLMPVGASIGDGFGPALITRNASDAPKSLKDLEGRRVAIPGRQTSAYLALRGLVDSFTEVPLAFRDIAPAVRNGEVDAGILIHELQMSPESQGLRKLGDLGVLWRESFGLPLPLGANAIRRGLGAEVIRDVNRLFHQSVAYGLNNRAETLHQALQASGADVTPQMGDEYISMYVNEHSLDLQPDVERAIAELFRIGHRHGLCGAVDLEANVVIWS